MNKMNIRKIKKLNEIKLTDLYSLSCIVNCDVNR